MALNKALYRRLCDLYGRIIIDHAGEEFNRPSIIDGISGRPRLHKIAAGEYYRLNCPLCPDRKKRLYISHMFGKTLSDKRKGSFLIRCFNETDCMSDPQNLHDFVDNLEMGARKLSSFKVDKGKKVTGPKNISMPGHCIPLHKLPYHHPANRYLGSRLVDGHRYSKLFGLSYCVSVTDRRYIRALHRIIWPIWSGTKLIGWQARFVGDIDWKREDVPKYYSCPDMTYSADVLNLAQARKYETGVIVEGWMDRWGVGPMSMPLMGHNLNDTQINKLSVAFRRGNVVYLLDPEEFDTDRHHKLIPVLRQKLAGRLALVRLPDKIDPDQLDKKRVLWPYITQEAARQGIKVSFKLRRAA